MIACIIKIKWLTLTCQQEFAQYLQYLTKQNFKMKKVFLSIMAMGLAATSVMANDYKFMFAGDDDAYGLTRQTSSQAAYLTFVKEVNIQEDGLEFSLTTDADAQYGFALVNAGASKNGLCVYSGFSAASFTQPYIKLTSPNGTITAVRLGMTGTAMASLDVNFNGVAVSCADELGVSQEYIWDWKDKDGVETVSIDWENNYYSRYIQYIEVTYTPDLSGKEASGLSFSQKEVEGFLGEKFYAPILTNPNKLPLTWTSSNEEIATVDESGKVTLVSRGTTTIKVSTEGNDQYAAGNARYELTVIPVATGIAQLIADAPELGDKVKINFPATVAFANGSYAFVTDEEGTAACFQDMRNQGSTSTTVTTIYKVGDVIPAGWVAANGTVNSSVIWQGVPDKVTETVEVTYPKVESVTPEDADRVVVLQNVTFTTETASGTTKAFGTIPGGETYEFQDTYGAPAMEPGTYDVTCVVRYSKRGDTVFFYLAPIDYVKSSSVAVESVEASLETPRYYNLQGCEVLKPEAGIYVKVAGGKATKVVVK